MTPQEQTDLEKIIEVVRRCQKVNEITLFGSRAKGTQRESSDWDIALKGSGLSFSDILPIQVRIDELWLPCAVDIVIYDQIENQSLKEHIDRVGQVVWSARAKNINLNLTHGPQ